MRRVWRGLIVGAWCALAGCRQPPRAEGGPARIVSLTPAMTETLFAIGAGAQVVGVDDFCTFPQEASERPHAGTMLAPNYEAIARLRPTRIVGEQLRTSPEARLQAIAPTAVLPWLTLSDVLQGVEKLGEMSEKREAAHALAERLRARLVHPAPPDAPRVLLTVAWTPGPITEVTYIKRGSLHGSVLEAAGGRNAVEQDVSGTPVLPVERLLQLDPDVVLVLVAADRLDDATRQRYLDAWKAFPMLKAVQRGAVKLVAGPAAQATGPRIVELADALAQAIRETRR